MRKKRKMKKSIKILGTLLIIIVIGSLGLAIKNHQSPKNQTSFAPVPEEQWPKISKISLVATGDALLHNGVYVDAYNKNTKTFDFTKQIALVKEEVKDYDIAYYNQETLFGGPQPDLFPTNSAYNIRGYSSYPYFNTPSEFGDAMLDAGFNMVSLATNHSADCLSKAKECIVNSYNYWQDKNVVFDGFNPTSENTNNYIIQEKNGITYTMLNYTSTLNGLDSRIKNDKYLVDMYDPEKVKADIEAVRDKVDVLIVAMHWHTGSEYTFKPTQKNIEITNYLSSLGVDIILGTYSHCLQPFDIVNNTVVFYSLGNLISSQGQLIDTIGYKGIVGVLANMDITKTTNEDGTSKIIIDNIGADLLYTYHDNKIGYLVVPFSKMEAKYNKNYKSIYKEYSQVLKNFNDNINIKPLPNN